MQVIVRDNNVDQALKVLKKKIPIKAINPLEKLAIASEKEFAINPITLGPAAPPASEISLHIPRKPPLLSGGDKSEPIVSTNPLDIPFPTPDKIEAQIKVE